MDRDTWIAGQDAAGSHADMPPSVMDMVVGQHGCAGHVQPLQPALHASRSHRNGQQGRRGVVVGCAPDSPGDQLAVVGDEDRLRGRVSVEIGSVVRASGIN